MKSRATWVCVCVCVLVGTHLKGNQKEDLSPPAHTSGIKQGKRRPFKAPSCQKKPPSMGPTIETFQRSKKLHESMGPMMLGDRGADVGWF